VKTGESFILFGFQKQATGKGIWVDLGWCKDAYGTWENLG
jgi:hypothetical protein